MRCSLEQNIQKVKINKSNIDINLRGRCHVCQRQHSAIKYVQNRPRGMAVDNIEPPANMYIYAHVGKRDLTDRMCTRWSSRIWENNV